MRARSGRVPAWLVAIGLTVLTVGLSRVPWTAESSPAAELRLAWRFRSERVTACRTRSPEELARLPQHMRRDTVCEPRLLPYRLVVVLDWATVADDTVRPRGARADRPLGMFRRLAVAPGTHRVQVTFAALEAAGGSRPLALDTTVAFRGRHVQIITVDENARRFLLLPRPAER